MDYNYHVQYTDQQKRYRICAVVFTIFLFFNTVDYLSSLRIKSK